MVTIKEAEMQTGITRQNIRYYEKIGLLQPSREQENKYRNYSEEDIRRLKLILLFRKLDMPLEEIRQLLEGTIELQDALQMQKEMLERAREHRDAHTYTASSMEEFKKLADEKPGFIKAMWCGCQECEDALKEEAGVTSRCIPFEQEEITGTCVHCGKPAKHMVYWGKAY